MDFMIIWLIAFGKIIAKVAIFDLANRVVLVWQGKSQYSENEVLGAESVPESAG